MIFKNRLLKQKKIFIRPNKELDFRNIFSLMSIDLQLDHGDREKNQSLISKDQQMRIR